MELLGFSCKGYCNITGELDGIAGGIKLTGHDTGSGENGNFQNFSGDRYCIWSERISCFRWGFERWKEETPGDVCK